jgi:hypothetical protein
VAAATQTLHVLERLQEVVERATGLGLALESQAVGLPPRTLERLAAEAEALCSRLAELQAALPAEGEPEAAVSVPGTA